MTDWRSRADGWVTRARVVGYTRLLLAVYALGLVALIATARRGLDLAGHPIGADFIIFYAASKLGLQGHAALAYHPAAILAAERSAVAASRGLFLWCYPPSFQLLIAPLALLAYPAALAVWLGVTGSFYLGAVRLISRHKLAIPLALAFPGAFLNLVQGQTGFLTAALLGGGLLLSDRRPLLAGLLLGLSTYKPHFALLVPLALMAAGRWRALAAMAATAAALAVVSAAAFGLDAWRSFFETLPAVAHNLASGALPLYKDPSLFASLSLLGAPHGVALAANLALAAPMVLLALQAWRRGAPPPLAAAMTVTAALALSPYAFDYDLAVLAVPLAVLIEHVRKPGAPAGARALAAVLFAAPLVQQPLAQHLGLQLFPLATVALFAALAGFARREISALGTSTAHLGGTPAPAAG